LYILIQPFIQAKADAEQDCQALNLLKPLLVSGTTARTLLPAIIPPPQLIGLIATLSVHPTLTTRAKALDRIQAANLSFQYLQLILKHVGPIRGSLEEAFTFVGRSTVARRSGGGRRKKTGDGASPSTDIIEGINNELANAGSLWAQADNFWQVVGWGFNCSILHKRRWERWSAWLAYMIEVLQADWDARAEEDIEENLEKSLIAKYINSGMSSAGRDRKIVRSVFADGRVKSLAEFGEIWPKETKELKKDGDVKRAEAKIDIQADNYGDYMEEENDEDLEDSGSESMSSSLDGNADSSESIPNTADDFGGMESVNLRFRLLSLLSKVSANVPDEFTDILTLYDTYVEHIRSLPIPAFFLIVSPSNLRHFTPSAASTLTQSILRSLIAASALLPSSDDISQETLENFFLPFAANTTSIVDNTKVSLCVETLLRLVNTHAEFKWTPKLHEAAEIGIKARFTKAKKKQTKRGTDADGNCGAMWLTASAERIRMVVAMAEH